MGVDRYRGAMPVIGVALDRSLRFGVSVSSLVLAGMAGGFNGSLQHSERTFQPAYENATFCAVFR